MSNKFYITTTLPYVNAKPHLGHALEFIQADAIVRWRRLKGDDVFFNIGTDEHGAKIYEKALEEKMDPKAYCDKNAETFLAVKEKLNISFDNFIRTTDKHHVMAAQEFWKKCETNGDIYKKTYKAKYCIGCEMEVTDSELVDDRCPDHPNRELEIREEENYFFRLSKYQKLLLEFYKKNPDFVIPELRFNEIKKFAEGGLEDFSISRLKNKMPWGVPVPGDDEHIMYVWFEALVNYISAIGWPDKEDKFKKWWPAYQVAGKNNLRQQSAMWQAMLMSAGLPNSKQIFIHGFINSAGGQKMSKSLGNVVDPIEMAEKYGIDPLRYYLLAKMSPFEDGEFSIENFEQTHTADLANGLGNLVARVSNLLEKNEIETVLEKDADKKLIKEFEEKMENYKFNEALEVLWKKLRACDETMTKTEPWKMKDKEEIKKVLEPVAQNILSVAELLQPFMPATSEKIVAQFSAKQVKKGEALFPRLN